MLKGPESLRDKMAKYVTKAMLGWISLVSFAIITAILLNHYGYVDLSPAYLGF